MKKLKYLIKKVIAEIINLILPIISRIKFNANIEEAKKGIYKFEKITKVYDEKSFKRNVSFDNKIDLSIIIPVYNAEKTIEMCLNSIVHQKTKYTFEIIVIDDGSTDNSKQILKDYENKYHNIKVIEQKNGGAGKARNTGINYAKRKVHRFY